MVDERSVPATTAMREDSLMGAEVDATEVHAGGPQASPRKVRKGLDVLARMLTESRFDFERPMAGLEIELQSGSDIRLPAGHAQR